MERWRRDLPSGLIDNIDIDLLSKLQCVYQQMFESNVSLELVVDVQCRFGEFSGS